MLLDQIQARDELVEVLQERVSELELEAQEAGAREAAWQRAVADGEQQLEVVRGAAAQAAAAAAAQVCVCVWGGGLAAGGACAYQAWLRHTLHHAQRNYHHHHHAAL
jgi:hypothetical protein